jgi:hypothetical protein
VPTAFLYVRFVPSNAASRPCFEIARLRAKQSLVVFSSWTFGIPAKLLAALQAMPSRAGQGLPHAHTAAEPMVFQFSLQGGLEGFVAMLARQQNAPAA